MQADKNYDLIISGGGMVGLALAAACHQLNLTVAVIEKNTVPELVNIPDTFSPRVSALNLASERLLCQLNAWQRIPTDRKTAYLDMNVWDGLGGGRIDFRAQDVQTSHLGHIVENTHIMAALWQSIGSAQNIDVYLNDTVETWQQDSRLVHVETKQGYRLCASVLANCEGKNSPTRQQSDIEQWSWPYNHTAIVTTVYHEKPHYQSAKQIFLETGPLAFLPLTCNEPNRHASSIVWSAKTEKAEQLIELTDEEFILQLETAIENQFGKILSIDARLNFPLVASQAKTYIDGRMVLLGDAAHTIHPLAGLGVNLGFLDAAALADSLGNAKKQNQDCGHQFVLRRYQRQRQSHNLAVAGLMEGLKRMFDTQVTVPVITRNLGLNLFNQIPLIKRPIIKGALGDIGTALPSLCKPERH